jgi:hypothetical protein
MSEVCTSTSTGGVECETKPNKNKQPSEEVSIDTNYFGLSLPWLLAILLIFGLFVPLFIFLALKKKKT